MTLGGQTCLQAPLAPLSYLIERVQTSAQLSQMSSFDEFKGSMRVAAAQLMPGVGGH